MTFNDLLRKMNVEVIQSGQIGMKENIVALCFSVIIGIYLFVIYRMFIRKTLYNLNLNIALVGMTVVTTAIMLTIQSNLMLSMGMVGALSIVRYRTAVKDPMDLFFLFWSIAGGIMCGAGQYLLALIVTLPLTILVFILGQLPSMAAPYVVVINGVCDGLEDAVVSVLEEHCRNYKIKSRSIVNTEERMIIEIKVRNEKNLLEDLRLLEGVDKISLLTYAGDVVC